MKTGLSPNTQAILLLTAPLIIGWSKPSVDPLTAGEYRRLARRLRELRREPAHLLEPDGGSLLKECGITLDPGQLQGLLDRGFLLAQAVERWRSRAIWVVSRADGQYPQRLKRRLKDNAPPVLYGCGDASILNAGGLAIVGSRNVNETLLRYTESVGRLTAAAGYTAISGGAQGIDQAAMGGALQAGGNVVAIVADGLNKAAVRREYREALMDGRLALVCPYDPAAHFNVGHAMQRNKLIYALADAALVVNADNRKGGAWAGASEQLTRLNLVPVYVRARGEDPTRGLAELQKLGAKPWPNPETTQQLEDILSGPSTTSSPAPEATVLQKPLLMTYPAPAEQLFAKVMDLLNQMDGLRTIDRVAKEMEIPRTLADTWLKRFIDMKLKQMFACSGMFKTVPEAAQDLQITDGQVSSALKHLLREGVVGKVKDKPSRCIKYCSTTAAASAMAQESFLPSHSSPGDEKNLQRQTVETLKGLCKRHGIRRYSKLRKADLIEMLERHGVEPPLADPRKTSQPWAGP